MIGTVKKPRRPVQLGILFGIMAIPLMSVVALLSIPFTKIRSLVVRRQEKKLAEEMEAASPCRCCFDKRVLSEEGHHGLRPSPIGATLGTAPQSGTA